MEPLGSGSAPISGVSLSKSKVRESFFLQAVIDLRRLMEPLEDSPKSMLKVMLEEAEGCEGA